MPEVGFSMSNQWQMFAEVCIDDAWEKVAIVDDPGADWNNMRLRFVPCRQQIISIEVQPE